MNKGLLKYLIPATVFIIIVAWILILSFDNKKSDYRLYKFDLSKIPGINATDWSRQFKAVPIPHIILQNTALNIKKYVFSTADCGIIEHGYKNRVELFIVFSKQGEVENVILGKNIETPALIEKMRRSDFFQQWDNRNKLEKVQYVTGATYSCKAISGGVSALQKLLKSEIFFR